jgi:hypothetical protein
LYILNLVGWASDYYFYNLNGRERHDSKQGSDIVGGEEWYELHLGYRDQAYFPGTIDGLSKQPPLEKL